VGGPGLAARWPAYHLFCVDRSSGVGQVLSLLWRGSRIRRASGYLQAGLALLLTVGVALAAGPWTVASAAGTPLRQVDWGAVLANDPTITVDPDAYQLPGNVGPHITVKAPSGEDLEGYVT